MNREIRVTIDINHSPDDMAMFLEVIAGDIRQGKTSGTEPGCIWEIG